MLKEARDPLKKLAGHLETELAERERNQAAKYPPGRSINIPFKTVRYGGGQGHFQEYSELKRVTTIYSPPGRRRPRVSYHMGHITVSWRGTPEYHEAAWYTPYADGNDIDYELKIFFKAPLKHQRIGNRFTRTFPALPTPRHKTFGTRFQQTISLL